jgi:hypothetical protein
MGSEYFFFFIKFINMKILINFNKLNHRVILILFSPFFIYFGINQITFPINIVFIIIGIFFIMIGNKKFEETNKMKHLFEILLLGPLLFIIGITKNKYDYLKNLLCVIGFGILLYSTRKIFINSFMLRR